MEDDEIIGKYRDIYFAKMKEIAIYYSVLVCAININVMLTASRIWNFTSQNMKGLPTAINENPHEQLLVWCIALGIFTIIAQRVQ